MIPLFTLYLKKIIAIYSCQVTVCGTFHGREFMNHTIRQFSKAAWYIKTI